MLPMIHIMGYYNEWGWWLKQVQDVSKNQQISQSTCWYATKLAIKKNIIRVDNSLVAYQLAIESCGIALARNSLVKPYIEDNVLKRMDGQSEFDALEGSHIHLTEAGKKTQLPRNL